VLLFDTSYLHIVLCQNDVINYVIFCRTWTLVDPRFGPPKDFGMAPLWTSWPKPSL